MMIAMVGRYLHQPISDVEDWDFVDFKAYHAAAGELLAIERPVEPT